MKKLLYILLFIVINYTVDAQKLESASFIRTFTKAEITLLAGGFPIGNDVDVYKVRYFTPDTEGVDHVASGLLAIPQNDALAFPLACFQHGTVGSRDEVPSNLDGGYTLGVIFAGLGYVVVQPDFVGLGDSPGIHPYVHADTEASAGVDFLRATRELSEDEDFPNFYLNDQLFIGGYSQGGHAAMALQREIELNLSNEFTVTASAPMSGPYSISEKMLDFTLGDQEYGLVAYLPFVTLSMMRAYPSLSQFTLEDVYKPEFISDINAFKNEEITLWELNGLLTDKLNSTVGAVIPKEMLLPEMLNILLTDPSHPLPMALADNDTYDWAPKAPTNLYYCVGDDQVTFENALLAEEVMTDNGSTVVSAVRVDMDSNLLDHGQCVSGASTGAIFFFNSFQDLQPVGADDLFSDPNISIYYTNPFLGVVIPQDYSDQNYTLEMYTTSGALSLTTQVEKGNSFEDVSELNEGMYVVVLRSAEGIVKTEKIIKF